MADRQRVGAAGDWYVMGDSRRYVELDGLRGVAAGSVVLYHLFHMYDVCFQPSTSPPPMQFSRGYFGVQLFFLISGFVILLTARNARSAGDFLAARFSRLYPTYWTCLTVSWVLALAVGVTGLLRSPVEIAVNYTMVQRILGVRSVDGAYWSLSVELLFYGLVWLLLVLGLGLGRTVVRRLVPVWMAVSVAVAVLAHARPDDTVVRLLGILSIAEYAPLFALGMLLLPLRDGERLGLLVLPTLAAAFVTAALFNGIAHACVVTGIAIAFAAVVAIPSCPPLRWRPLVFVGEISYPLYLVHQNVGYVALEHLVGPVGRTPASLIALVLVVALAWVVHVTVEGPVSRWVRNRLRQPRPELAAARPHAVPPRLP